MAVRSGLGMLVLSTLLALGGAAASFDGKALDGGAIDGRPDGRIAGSLAVGNPAPAAPGFPDATLAQSERDGVTVLRVDGIITPVVERRFADAVHALPARRPLVLELSSPGGFTSAGYRMIDSILAERQSGRPVATRVRGGESCESMCVGLYLAGYPRYAAPTAQFMVHAPRLAENGRMTLRATEAMVQRLVALGASPVWIGRVKAAGGFSGAVDYRENAARLTAEGANIVTDLLR
ncbi:ATP-dependent Clp protease proteolytic subunit [Azospirillum thermophilum]|uniref:Uncharacterized protein n=1 Tax=Azospirillum thermophilum TaxID=2202148 RepID=A0A2S2CKV6_9PROT|nr:ATP-dependent Clp protease proteolytic subunit [Azospirillum thermophilum]AWK85112.1 hypothetical protein DEW08_01980 [Azospirillum thermophilum]